MGIRFGLDIGIASVGWAVVADDYQVLESGANLFESADASKNQERRSFRQMKRLHRRRHTRMKDFETLWKDSSLEIPEGICSNPLELRMRGLKEELTKDEVYFVLKNMLIHRGISYLEDALDEGTSAKSDYQRGILENQKQLDEDKFPCEIQYERLKQYGRYRGDNTVVDGAGEKMVLSNVFTIGAYRKEIQCLLDRQRMYHDFLDGSFMEQYMEIFGRKRAYYDGPGNELSRTDYGKYTTKIDPETGKYITEDNIFEKLIGKCSVYPDEMRASGASYTAQEFNVLNDLNNLTINNRKLDKQEKEKIIYEMQNARSVNVRKLIKKAMGEEIQTMTGARVDKNGKEEFHQFKGYNLLRKALEEKGLSIQRFSREELDKIGDILTLNTEKESILQAFQREKLDLAQEEQECLIAVRKKNGGQFNKWQSLSFKIMKELIPQMYEKPANQMELLTEMGVFKSKAQRFAEYSVIPGDLMTEEIYNPVVSRSVRITMDVINALVRKYGYPREVVIEMPRDKNEDLQKKRITEEQKKNEKELKDIISKIHKEYNITITDEMFRNHKQLVLKLKLWNEQDGRCPYSGRMISVSDLLHDPQMFEIDHIIPKSISFDDSRSNKVLVYRTENQLKGNTTPFLYLQGVDRE